ncbi:hypothetical protein HAX54_045536 [Datura stramonium]|uniref:Uncharacterized protein n=1 Tax=Datura stramonium TaxID=4076 RepID=A0ABS8SQM9_DATST|nr:hypothetical protein [Datura stramonium]
MSSNMYTGFTRLCKGLAVVLVGGHIVAQILPSAVSYLALIPAKVYCGGRFEGICLGAGLYDDGCSGYNGGGGGGSGGICDDSCIKAVNVTGPNVPLSKEPLVAALDCSGGNGNMVVEAVGIMVVVEDTFVEGGSSGGGSGCLSVVLPDILLGLIFREVEVVAMEVNTGVTPATAGLGRKSFCARMSQQ